MIDDEGGIDIGFGHIIHYYSWTDSDAIVGLIDSHQKPDGSRCEGGSVLFRTEENAGFTDAPHWDVISVHPLTLSPSLLCRICGNHGWITNGRWVPAD